MPWWCSPAAPVAGCLSCSGCRSGGTPSRSPSSRWPTATCAPGSTAPTAGGGSITAFTSCAAIFVAVMSSLLPICNWASTANTSCSTKHRAWATTGGWGSAWARPTFKVTPSITLPWPTASFRSEPMTAFPSSVFTSRAGYAFGTLCSFSRPSTFPITASKSATPSIITIPLITSAAPSANTLT